MKKSQIFSSILLITVFSAVVITACKKDAAPAAELPNYAWHEEFDTLANSFAKGWVSVNNSRPVGISSWTQASVEAADSKGKAVVPSYPFAAQSAVYSGKDFIMISQNAVDDQGTISAWLISPPTMMKNGDVIEFYTRTVPTGFQGTGTPDLAERMQVRLASTKNSTEVGNTATSVGDFSTLMLDINPTYAITGDNMYPQDWKKYSITISGLAPTIQERRFAFRYFVEDGGFSGSRSYCVGVDNVSFISK